MIDNNLQLDADFVYAEYNPPQDPSITNFSFTGVSPVTNISGASGPNIAFGGSSGLTFSGAGNTITVAGTLVVGNGGTGSTNAAGARTNLGAAASGVNADITQLTGLTTALSIAQGGTAAVTAAAARTSLSVPRVTSALVAPAVTDDGAAGFPVGSLWVDTVLDDGYLSVDDSTGAAIWKLIT